jgi:hypothetical protein
MGEFFYYEDGQIKFKLEAFVRSRLKKNKHKLLSISIKKDIVYMESINLENEGHLVKDEFSVKLLLDQLDYWVGY